MDNAMSKLKVIMGGKTSQVGSIIVHQINKTDDGDEVLMVYPDNLISVKLEILDGVLMLNGEVSIPIDSITYIHLGTKDSPFHVMKLIYDNVRRYMVFPLDWIGRNPRDIKDNDVHAVYEVEVKRDEYERANDAD